MFETATAKHGLGWSNSQFWKSTPQELFAALEVAEEHAEAIRKAQQRT